jgi:hypothetical protein
VALSIRELENRLFLKLGCLPELILPSYDILFR